MTDIRPMTPMTTRPPRVAFGKISVYHNPVRQEDFAILDATQERGALYYGDQYVAHHASLASLEEHEPYHTLSLDALKGLAEHLPDAMDEQDVQVHDATTFGYFKDVLKGIRDKHEISSESKEPPIWLENDTIVLGYPWYPSPEDALTGGETSHTGDEAATHDLAPAEAVDTTSTALTETPAPQRIDIPEAPTREAHWAEPEAELPVTAANYPGAKPIEPEMSEVTADIPPTSSPVEAEPHHAESEPMEARHLAADHPIAKPEAPEVVAHIPPSLPVEAGPEPEPTQSDVPTHTPASAHSETAPVIGPSEASDGLPARDQHRDAPASAAPDAHKVVLPSTPAVPRLTRRQKDDLARNARKAAAKAKRDATPKPPAVEPKPKPAAAPRQPTPAPPRAETPPAVPAARPGTATGPLPHHPSSPLKARHPAAPKPVTLLRAEAPNIPTTGPAAKVDASVINAAIARVLPDETPEVRAAFIREFDRTLSYGTSGYTFKRLAAVHTRMSNEVFLKDVERALRNQSTTIKETLKFAKSGMLSTIVAPKRGAESTERAPFRVRLLHIVLDVLKGLREAAKPPAVPDQTIRNSERTDRSKRKKRK